MNDRLGHLLLTGSFISAFLLLCLSIIGLLSFLAHRKNKKSKHLHRKLNEINKQANGVQPNTTWVDYNGKAAELNVVRVYANDLLHAQVKSAIQKVGPSKIECI